MDRDSSPDFVREINDTIAELGERFDLREETLELMCECGDSVCDERVTIPTAEYERLRASGRRVVHRGHERGRRVVEAAESYVALGA